MPLQFIWKKFLRGLPLHIFSLGKGKNGGEDLGGRKVRGGGELRKRYLERGLR